MNRRIFRQAATVTLSLAFLLGQVTWALAGTTGNMTGTVLDADTGAPIAGASIRATSPSQTVTATSDAAGRFIFISLVPDTYTVSGSKAGYTAIDVPGIVVFADATATASLRLTKALKTIANVTSRAASSLVRPGTTSDVYSVNSAMQDKVSALGGGGSLNSAYSAVASVPGAFVPLNQTGYFQTVHIRGGDYDQVGYELDGVPVNRSFDNYPSGAASSLGQQEVQVYTGATPANSEGEGLAGYINQVIKSGTFPGFGQGALAVGTPTFYHKAAVEAGGSTPNRLFSYYVGIGGYNQEFRYVDQFNANDYTFLSSPITPQPDPAGCSSIFTGFASCYAAAGFGVGPGGWNLAPYPWANIANIADRDVVVNLHFGIQHRNDGGRDDVQLLYDSGMLNNAYYSSTNDAGGPPSYNGIANVPTWTDGFQWSGPVGGLLPSNYSSFVSNYLFPDSPTNRALGAPLGFDARDTTWNNQNVVKLQYQKNFGTNAYVRLYGYTYYSDWLQNGPNCAFQNYVCAVSPDYELSSHTRGAALQASDQINSQNLISLTGSYTTASTIRDNNTQMFNGGGARSRAFVAVNSADPLSGLCYTVPASNTGAATPTTCDPSADVATFATWKDASTNSIPNISGATCGSAPCAFLVAENSLYATYNTVKPSFISGSLTDELRLGDHLLFNLGVRLDTFQFNGSDTDTGPARDFWFNSWNLDNCQNVSSGVVAQKVLPISSGGLGLVSPTDACPAGYRAVNFQNVSSPVNYYQVWQPRISGTYTLNPDTVIRASYGKYVEPPNTAFEQYNALQENLPWLLGTTYNFYAFGFTTPGHLVTPPVSYNTDLSLEHHFKGSEFSVKLTPFLRKTSGQIQNFFLNQQTGFVSGFNVGHQTSEGFELQVNGGDFNRNGLAGQLSFAYTNSYVQYSDLPNGTTVVSPINAAIQQYNGFTSACHANAIAHGGTPTNPNCGPNSATSAPCFTAATTTGPGVPDATCAAGSISSPYWNAPIAATLNPTANYPTYDIFPGGIGTSGAAFGSPYVLSAILNYKHDRLAITPTMQLVAGARYGAPLTEPGVDPSSCASLAGPVIAGDPRYPYGSAGGSPYNAVTCAAQINIPNPYTKQFDPMGSFLQPDQFIMNIQLSYEVTPRLSLVGTFANIITGCWGGTSQPWNLSSNGNVCQYNVLNTAGTLPPVGNFYNWSPSQATPIQRMVQYPYAPYLGGVNVDSNGNGSVSNKGPFNFFIEARLKV